MKGNGSRKQAWFAARLLFESVDVETGQGGVFEDRIIVLRSSTEETARERALVKGREGEIEYDTAAGGHLRWAFRALTDLKSLIDDEIEDGCEVYYAYVDLAEANSLWSARTHRQPAGPQS